MKRDRRSAIRMVKYLKHFIGIEYRFGNDEYGGDDPVKGFDCSGLATEGMRAVGRLKESERLSANMILNRGRMSACIIEKPIFGALVLFGKNDKASHVGICIDNKFMIEAGGGTSTTKSLEDSSRRNAFVRLRPINRRNDIIAYVDPFLKTWTSQERL